MNIKFFPKKHYYHYCITFQKTVGNIETISGILNTSFLVLASDGYKKIQNSIIEKFELEEKPVTFVSFSYLGFKRKKGIVFYENTN